MGVLLLWGPITKVNVTLSNCFDHLPYVDLQQ